jgi:glycosyltransferase involved in cell wall biosynthesis
MLVSIVTPSYNQAEYLEAALRSVEGQDYPHIEHLVVDGGSSDGSVEIIQRHAAHLAWWVSERDSGQAEAINKGMRGAQGEIVAWLNSDDLYLPGAISSAVKALQADPGLGLVYGEALSIDQHGRPFNRFRFGDWGLVDLMGFRMICQPAVFMRRSVFEQAGPLAMDYHYMLDHHLWIRMAGLAPVKHVPMLWAAARIHPGAKNVRQAPGFGVETLRLLEWMQAQPALADLYQRNQRMINGGAYRLNARYLLDGERYGEALRSYLKALWFSPAYALRHAHRIAYAVACLLGGKRLADRFASRTTRRPFDAGCTDMLQGWPGINV